MAASDVAQRLAPPGARLAIVKLGGSVLTGLAGLPGGRVVSEARRRRWRVAARRRGVGRVRTHGRAGARGRRAGGDAGSAALDLLWSTGELRSVALLTLALRNAGVSATGLNAHEAGLRVGRACRGDSARLEIEFQPRPSRGAGPPRRRRRPGISCDARQQIVTLGRGGSDLSAVLLAEALGADRCVLIKDVDGYFTSDPATHDDAKPIGHSTYARALAMADAGCPLVQRQALAAAERGSVPLVVRSFTSIGTLVGEPIPARHFGS